MKVSDPDILLRELILYVSARCQNMEHFGAVKLNKILFYSDFTAYKRLGKSITGCIYQKLEQGPCPRKLLPVRNRMVAQRILAIREEPIGGYVQERTVHLREADLSKFSGQEIAIVESVIERYRDDNASNISRRSHDFIGWKLAELKETIPYEAVLVSRPQSLTEEQLAYAESLNDIAVAWKNGQE